MCSFRRVLQLEGQLTSLQEEAEVRQAEMQAAIDALRQDKKSLEAQVAGVNLHAVEAGDPLVLQVCSVPVYARTFLRQQMVSEMGFVLLCTWGLCCQEGCRNPSRLYVILSKVVGALVFVIVVSTCMHDHSSAGEGGDVCNESTV